MKKLMIFILLISIMLCGCQEIKKISSSSDIPDAIESKEESHLTGSLYDLRKTELEDTVSIKSIFSTIPFFLNNSVAVNVSGTNIIAKYKIEYLTKYRNKSQLKQELLKVASVVYSLVPECKSIQFVVNDKYNSVYEFSCTKDKLHSMYDMSYFSEENIDKAAKKRNEFERYIIKILDISYDKEELSVKEEEINKRIGIDCESDKKPHHIIEKEYILNMQIPGIDLNTYAIENNVDLSLYDGRKIEIEFYNVKNYVNNTVTPWMFIFCDDKILGCTDLYGEINEQDVINRMS